uniref:Two-component response regulator-like APRR5 n=1 Tax=Cajanus cajan TaxID=3821 RepID=A0A151TY61_CAJCA|nr:Two-component response regulator-like APRR5 [Cajanus cajan]
MGEVMQTQGEQSNNASAVRWERFLPRMVLRVLLVEADDSTRQIIAALLRKCSYKVATVRDGLKAWETLKDKASDIDLILTEVDLPSISGFSLLTLIMEHDICKNIPVIMMSSHDSVSMVFKCMLKGASDFLIKPVRKNELRNLWQHVWRRHAISGPPQNLTLPQIELGVAAENDAASTDSSGSVASTPKNNECSEETSEAQDISQLKSSSNLSNIDTVNHENSTKCERDSDKYNDEAGEKSIFISEAARCNRTFKPTGLRVGRGYDFHEKKNQDEVLRIELSKANPQINTDIHECSDELVDPSTGAIDLIATFKNLPNRTDEKCSGNTAKFDFDTQLELSLRQDFPGSSCKAASEERQILNHSNVSAFSRYSSSKLLQPLFPTPSTISDKLTNASQNSHESHKLSENAYTSLQYGGKNQNQEKFITLVIGQSGQADPKLQNSQLGSFPATGVTSDHNNLDCETHDSSAAGQCADTSNHNSNGVYRSIGCKRDGNATSAKVVGDSHESFIDSGHRSYDGFLGTDSHRTSQREAALTKFRLKRKDRCYEKKVRYQSRKRLAEQRPRVKGQFVRQVHNDHPVADAGGGS